MATILSYHPLTVKLWPSDKLIMFVIIKNLHIKTGVINLVIDLSLHSQLFRVYCYCIDVDHILALVIVVLGGYYWLLQCLPAVYLHVIVNSCMK